MTGDGVAGRGCFKCGSPLDATLTSGVGGASSACNYARNKSRIWLAALQRMAAAAAAVTDGVESIRSPSFCPDPSSQPPFTLYIFPFLSLSPPRDPLVLLPSLFRSPFLKKILFCAVLEPERSGRESANFLEPSDESAWILLSLHLGALSAPICLAR